MPYPEKPQIQTSYTSVEQSLGDGSLPGQELDVDFASLKMSVEDTIDFLKTSLRSDGKLANGSVTSEALAASIRIGFNPPTPWVTAQSYTTQDTVFQGFGFYLCTAAHTSGVFATDFGSGRWLLLADLTPPGGALIADQNLTDLTDVAAARAALGLGTMATATAGTGATQFQTNAENDADFQPLDADLTAIAALTSAANKVPYATGAGTWALADLTAAGRALLDDANAAAQLATLGLTATAAEINAVDGVTATGTSLIQVANDAALRTLMGFSQVTGSPRRLTLPGGMIIQGGSGSTTLSGVTVTFPQAFSANPTFVLGTNAAGNATITFQSLSSTAVFVQGWNPATGAAANVAFNWLAFGE